MYSNEQSVIVFPKSVVAGGQDTYDLVFYRPGQLNASQFLLLNNTFSNIRPFIAATQLKIIKLYCISSHIIGNYTLALHSNNIEIANYSINTTSYIQETDIFLSAGANLSLKVTGPVKDVIIYIKISHE